MNIPFLAWAPLTLVWLGMNTSKQRQKCDGANLYDVYLNVAVNKDDIAKSLETMYMKATTKMLHA